MGHVYAQRFLSASRQSSQDEWKAWMARYADHPQAKQFDVLLKTKQAEAKNLITGTLPELRYFANGSKYLSEKYDSGQRYEMRLVRKEVEKSLNRGAVTAALNFFNAHRVQRYIDPIDKAQILASIASHYLYLDHKDKARDVALKALKTSQQAPMAGWVAGLVSWIDNDMAEAARYFTIASNAPYASPWMTAAASYWGARASTRAGLYRDVSSLLAKAVTYQRTFYGLIATKAMGYGYDFNWTMPDFTAAEHNHLLAYPAGARAVALAQVGRLELAERELFNLPVKNDPALAQAAIALANHYDMAGYAMRFSLAQRNPAGGYYDAGLFPVSSWTRNVGKEADIALLNAFIRQESRFMAQAKNKTGATGLMQLMPETAAFVSGDGVYKTEKGRGLLSRPLTNVKIGEKYLQHLLGLEVVNGDLFALTMAYNAGPGKLQRWKKDIVVDDPLLFIELIPWSETRAFVERVVTNYWIYQMQLGIEPKTLTAVASGQWPKID
jgi:soluble lytic murein transglycosylase-like protein